jgi:DNA repair exonuclease SbcCD ATPase subunit
MTVMDTCHSLQARIQALQGIQQSAAEAEQLGQRLSEAQALNERLSAELKAAQFLLDHNVFVEFDAIEVTGALRPLNKIIDRFSENPQSASLTRGQDWKKLRDNCKHVQTQLATELPKAWRRFVDNLHTGQSPEDLEAILAMTKANESALAKYRDLYHQLKNLRTQLPEDGEEISGVIKRAEKLKEVATKFDFDVPEKVKIFLAAIAQGGAPLNLLTDDVVQWLSENRSEKHYRIVGNQ